MKFKYILVSMLFLSFLNIQVMADEKEKEKDTYKLKVTHVEPKTTLVVKCEGLVNFKSQKGILKHGYTEQKQVLKRYAYFRA